MNVGLDEVFNPKLQGAVRTMALKVDDLRVYYRTLRGDVQALDGVTLRGRPTARSWGWPASRAAASRRSARA